MKNENISITSQDRSKESRERILLTALELFATQGFEKTSTREIATKANVNLSSIKYYFGDKANLYKASYKEPMKSNVQHDINLLNSQNTIEDAITALFKSFIAPLKENENVKLCIKLHMREMIEPTGIWDLEMDSDLLPYHYALTQVLKKELGNNFTQKDLNRLAFSILSLAIFLYIGQDMIIKTDHSLINTNASLDIWSEKLVSYAKAMIETEKSIGVKNV